MSDEVKDPHRTCRRKIENRIDSIGHHLYVIETYGKDKCPTAGITPQVMVLIEATRKSVDALRRGWRSGLS